MVTGNHLLGRIIEESEMTKKLLLILAVLLIVGSPLCAQEPAKGTPANNYHWVPISACLGMAIASSLCGLAQGKAIAAAVEGMARNPGAAKAIQLAMLIGLAFIESLALYTLLIVFVFAK
jgi:F-type H+-transporting ATPase subunit c